MVFTEYRTQPIQRCEGGKGSSEWREDKAKRRALSSSPSALLLGGVPSG